MGENPPVTTVLLCLGGHLLSSCLACLRAASNYTAHSKLEEEKVGAYKDLNILPPSFIIVHSVHLSNYQLEPQICASKFIF